MYDHQPTSPTKTSESGVQVKKAKAVERAIERMRQGLGEQWGHLNDSEIEELEWVLGELWAYVARAEWDDLHSASSPCARSSRY